MAFRLNVSAVSEQLVEDGGYFINTQGRLPSNSINTNVHNYKRSINIKTPFSFFTEEWTVHVALTLQKQKIDDFVGHEHLFEVDIAPHHWFRERQLLQFTKFGENLPGQHPIKSFSAPDAKCLNVRPNLGYSHPLALFRGHVTAGDVQESVAALRLEQLRHGTEADVGFQFLQSGQEFVFVVRLTVHQRGPFQDLQRFQLGAWWQFQWVDVVDALVTQFGQIIAELIEDYLTEVGRHVVERYFLQLSSKTTSLVLNSNGTRRRFQHFRGITVKLEL